MFPLTVDEIHDLPPLDAALRCGVQEAMLVNLMRCHARVTLLLVEPLLELLGSQPMSRILVGQSGSNAFLVLGIGSMPQVKKKSRYLAWLVG